MSALIIDKGWQMGWVTPQRAKVKLAKKVAIVGSGPAGLVAAQQPRSGHEVTVFEKNSRPGGLLAYGIPDFKLDKSLIFRQVYSRWRPKASFSKQMFWLAASRCQLASPTIRLSSFRPSDPQAV